MLKSVLDDFKQHGKGLNCIYELPEKGMLEFIDLSIKFMEGYVCWAYTPYAHKKLLCTTQPIQDSKERDSNTWILGIRALELMCL